MVLKLQRLFHANAGFKGHAHPSPQATVQVNEEVQRIHDLVSNLAIDLQLRGLSGENDSKVTDIYCPRVRRSSLTDGAVSHLDVISCWKGLSRSQAVELSTWEYIFKACLENEVALAVHDIFVQYLGQHKGASCRTFTSSLVRKRRITDGSLTSIPDPTNETLLLPRLFEWLSHSSQHLIDIDISALVHAMIRRSCEGYPNPAEIVLQLFPWSLSERDLPNFLYNFLHTQDCFFNSVSTSCVFVELSYRYTNSTIEIVGDVDWRSPNVNFPNLPRQLSHGALYSISPRSSEVCLGVSLSVFSAFDCSSNFSISRPQLPFHWDSMKECFKAQLPSHGLENLEPFLYTTVCASITKVFPGDVRFERTSRYYLKLEISDDERPEASVNAYRRKSLLDIHTNDSRCDFRDNMAQSPQPTNRQTRKYSDCENSWVPSYSSTPLSKLCSPVEPDCSAANFGRDSFFDETDKGRYSPVVNHQDPRTKISSLLKNRPDWLSLPGQETLGNIPTDVNTGSAGRGSRLYSDLFNQTAKYSLMFTHGHGPPQKRKVSTYMGGPCDVARQAMSDQPEYQDQELDTKRRRLQNEKSAEDMGGRLRRTESSVSMRAIWNDWKSSLTYTPPITHGSTNYSCEVRPESVEAELQAFCQLQNPTTAHGLLSPFDSESSHDGNTPPPPVTGNSSDHSQTSTVLSQEQIQHNYYEFERIAAEKRQSVPSEECKAFEDIFLEDSGAEDWLDDVTSSSDTLEDVAMEE